MIEQSRPAQVTAVNGSGPAIGTACACHSQWQSPPPFGCRRVGLSWRDFFASDYHGEPP
ncbi:hypothetical protein OF001_U270040 [Pseudomonas sp. OF001]|nr:hypothetical protein OF001_U270040 [Pseudomonas sp. OF001]